MEDFRLTDSEIRGHGYIRGIARSGTWLSSTYIPRYKWGELVDEIMERCVVKW
jgi:hypothetical protein